MTISPEVLDQWKIYLAEEQKDMEFISDQSVRDQLRKISREQMLELLEGYLTGQVSNEEFRSTFDRKTRKEWDQFGLAGMNGAMFLNMLVKHIGDQELLAQQFRKVLHLPQNVEIGKQKMQAFLDYLNDLIQTGKVTRREVQPARLPFFLSAWWHLQDLQTWPPCYGTATRVLERERLYRPSVDLVKNYFEFRRVFLDMADALQLSTWEFEHLCVWLDQPQEKGGDSNTTTINADQPDENRHSTVEQTEETSDEEAVPERNKFIHTQVQWVLAKMGQKFGLKVWIAKNDRSKVWDGETLGSLSINDLPLLGMDDQSQSIIRMIDVVWLRGNNQIVGAFEIEYTTSIYSGLLRMADLATLVPNLTFPLYIVAPEERISMVRRELSRPTFQFIELHQRCGFFSIEELLSEKENILRWANDISAINRLAKKVR